MVCVHLQDLYQVCQTHQLKLSGSDLIRIICTQCGHEEDCPSVLMDEYETRHPNEEPPKRSEEQPGQSNS